MNNQGLSTCNLIFRLEKIQTGFLKILIIGHMRRLDKVSGGHEGNPFGDIGSPIANTFEIVADPQQEGCPTDIFVIPHLFQGLPEQFSVLFV